MQCSNIRNLKEIRKKVKKLGFLVRVRVLNIIGYDILQVDLINEIKEAKFFSILADEVESHKVE